MQGLAFDTLLAHADDSVVDGTDIAPPIHVSTAFEMGASEFVYSRVDTPTRKRLEAVLAAIEGDPAGKAITFSSGLSALVALLFALSPRRIFIHSGYKGSQNLFKEYKEHHAHMGGKDIEIIELADNGEGMDAEEGDLIFLEVPHNSKCFVPDIPAIAERAHQVNALVVVDATFGTPVLIQPLTLGADIVMHSSSKYLGGHSDLLGGVLVIKTRREYAMIRAVRMRLGNVMGSMETFLLLRSLRTLTLRVEKQSRSAWEIAQWLVQQPLVKQVHHPFLPGHPSHEVAVRLLKMGPSCFFVDLSHYLATLALPDNLHLFIMATSLGGFHSSIEIHGEVLDPGMRISVGLEDPRDLIQDLKQAFDKTQLYIQERTDNSLPSPPKARKEEKCSIC